MGSLEISSLLSDAAALGLSLTAHDGKLRVTGPKTAEAAALVQQLAQHKAAVIEILHQPAPLPPMRRRTSKPALPVDQWVTAATFAEAWRQWQTLKEQYFCSVGKDGSGFYVRCNPEIWRLVPQEAI